MTFVLVGEQRDLAPDRSKGGGSHLVLRKGQGSVPYTSPMSDVMEYDVVVVGAGPAGLACAIRLKQLKPELGICVLEKGSAVGAQLLSGCVMEPGPLDALLPEWRESPPGDLRAGAARRVPAADPHAVPGGCRIRRRCTTAATSSSRSASSQPGWRRARRRSASTSFRASPRPRRSSPTTGASTGVRIGDMGLDKDGRPGPNYTPGAEIRAGTTVLAEGCRGSVSKQLIARLGLARRALAADLRARLQGTVAAARRTRRTGTDPAYDRLAARHAHLWRQFPLSPRPAIACTSAIVVGLDYADPRFKPFEAFQQFKHHPTHAAAARGRRTARLRRAHDRGRRLAVAAAHGRCPDCCWSAMPPAR